MTKNRCCWSKCNRCGERELIQRKEINSARGARCKACGGRLEVSKDQLKKMAHALDARRSREERKP